MSVDPNHELVSLVVSGSRDPLGESPGRPPRNVSRRNGLAADPRRPCRIVANVSLPRSPSAEYTMAMPAETARRWTAREVRELIAAAPLATPRYELVDGELLVTPGPGLFHQRAVAELVAVVLAYLRIEGVGHVITAPADVELEPEFLTQPDVLVVPITEWRRVTRDGPPIRELLLAGEVLSPWSSRHDRVRKRPLYQRHVSDYWIVDLDARLFERWTPTDERPALLTHTLVWHPVGAVTPFVLDVPSFFTTVLET